MFKQTHLNILHQAGHDSSNSHDSSNTATSQRFPAHL